jgi:hypothetical protein
MYQLYLENYKDKVPENSLVSLPIYQKTFNEEYNFSFHVPKKDQCNICVSYNRGVSNGSITEDEKIKYNEHQQMKMRAREEKKKDKEHAKISKDTFVATSDLQAVLQTSCSIVSQIYYMCKLNCYNLSIYNLGSQSATRLPGNIKHVILYSDACSGQSRNQLTATALMHAVVNLSNIEIIDHRVATRRWNATACIQPLNSQRKRLIFTSPVNGPPLLEWQGGKIPTMSSITV